MAVERFDVAQNLPRVVLLVGQEKLAAHQERERATVVEHVAADAAVQVFFGGDGGEDIGGFGVGDFLSEHALADLFKRGIDVLQRIGGVFGIGGIQVEQHILAIGDVAGLAACPQPLQAKHRQFLLAHREQDVTMQHEGHGNVAGFGIGVEQEVGMQVHFAVVIDVEARAGLQVGEVVGVGQFEAEILADPGAHEVGRRDQVHPDRFDVGQVGTAVDLYLGEATVLQLECVEHAAHAGIGTRADQFFAQIVGQDFEDGFAAVFVDLLPGDDTVLIGEHLENACDVGCLKSFKQHLQLGQVLLMDQVLDQLMAWHVLPVHQILDAAMSRQQQLHLGEVLLEQVFGAGADVEWFGHGFGGSRAERGF